VDNYQTNPSLGIPKLFSFDLKKMKLTKFGRKKKSKESSVEKI